MFCERQRDHCYMERCVNVDITNKYYSFGLRDVLFRVQKFGTDEYYIPGYGGSGRCFGGD